MRDTSSGRAQALRQLAAGEGIGLRTVALDVQSEKSVQAAVATVLAEAGELDVVVDHAGHLAIGYVEAFATDDVAHLFYVNVLSAQRVNRAVLPHLRDRARARAHGTLLYVGSTSIIDAPPSSDHTSPPRRRSM
ncbi:SDR family NAD(P)-dependent oxidoreductase [Streptomyces sp. DR7-3]|uniref:SDR family NAD(P)-dependent oxidoreductase n=1 Tax=Streptomyces malaysiensis TaxID=92644 RepID=UPI002043B7FB|nr:SDR family NAD(P)-dependent oxidoreductase [Streptomyces sp. DR7-3]MCM3809391.1 SDR family NAD(P)-dependent oxidoreductase [Streptomyces sp. DR7-3]